ncbi:MAG: NlpC/P60 family protein [Actinomycetota bacterium]
MRATTTTGRRSPARAIVAIVVALAVWGVATTPAGAETPIEAAQRRAAALERSVAAREIQVDTASAEFDRASSELAQAVSDEIAAQELLAEAGDVAAGSDDAYETRVRAVYKSGGRLALMSSVLQAHTLSAAIDRYSSVKSVVQGDLATSNHNDAALARSAAAAAKLSQISSKKVTLQRRAEMAHLRVENALAQEQQLLASADEQVRVIAEQNAAAERVAQELAFAAALKKAQLAAAQTFADPNVPPPNERAAIALAAARTQIGRPYLWGAVGPAAFDCSGLTGWAYRQAGVELPRVSMDQWNAGPHPDLASLLPGDLVFWASDLRNSRTIHHVALYIGAGMMIAAPHAGTLVRIQPMYANGYLGATRPT